MKPPDKIYLQIGDEDASFDGVSFEPGTEVSWCADRIFDSDVEYVLAPREKRLKRYKEAEETKK